LALARVSIGALLAKRAVDASLATLAVRTSLAALALAGVALVCASSRAPAVQVAARELPALPADSLPSELASDPPFGLTGKDRATPPPLDAPAARVGRKLFFDPLLSSDRTVACASCHQPAHGFAAPSATSPGVHGRRTQRNAPSLFNRALGARFMWDGRAPTLAEQVLQPIENPDEMGLALADALQRVAADAEYARLFRAELGGAPTRETLARSLAAFVRTLWIGDSPVDRFQAGDAAALADEERTGLWVYESKGRCWRCHSGVNFSDELLHNTGVGARDGAPEDGRFAVTRDEADRGRFKTPTLRGLAFTAPYMHDGSVATLREVVEYYARGANANSHLAPEIEPLELTEDETVGLVRFLEALSRRADGAPR
jgi:cytochrome c peroxidase